MCVDVCKWPYQLIAWIIILSLKKDLQSCIFMLFITLKETSKCLKKENEQCFFWSIHLVLPWTLKPPAYLPSYVLTLKCILLLQSLPEAMQWLHRTRFSAPTDFTRAIQFSTLGPVHRPLAFYVQDLESLSRALHDNPESCL